MARLLNHKKHIKVGIYTMKKIEKIVFGIAIVSGLLLAFLIGRASNHNQILKLQNSIETVSRENHIIKAQKHDLALSYTATVERVKAMESRQTDMANIINDIYGMDNMITVGKDAVRVSLLSEHQNDGDRFENNLRHKVLLDNNELSAITIGEK